MKKVLFILMLLFPFQSFAADPVSITEVMPYDQFKKSGLEKLSPQEIKAISSWLDEYVESKVKDCIKAEDTDEKKKESGGLSSIFSDDKNELYRIQDASHASSFEINNHNFEATEKCPAFKRGDKVVFLEGSAYGICTKAVFARPDGSQKCTVWCEDD